ncbi:MAG: S41 family peptidase [Caldilineaceae bacterium]
MNIRILLVYVSVLICVFLAFVAGFLSYPTLQPLLNEQLTPIVEPEKLADTPNLTVFHEVWEILNRDFYGQKPPSEKQVASAIFGLVGSYNDPYTRFEEPVQAEINETMITGSFGGIGASVEMTTTGFILHPLPDNPAAQAGIVDGDLLIQVDETVLTTTMFVDEIVALIRGEVGSAVTLVIRRESGQGAPELLNFSVTRVEIVTPSMEWRLLDDATSTANIGYIRQFEFNGRSPEEMRKALSDLQTQGADRFILDLRGNPGGPVNAALEIADMWLDDGALLFEREADGAEHEFDATVGLEAGNAPLVVVVDGGSASASEIVAGALQDRRRALLVGEQTYGKGSVQLRYGLSDGSSLFVTNARWFTPLKHQISGTGLTPDVIVDAGVDPIPAAIASVQQMQIAQR